jgi:hypothetical protein
MSYSEELEKQNEELREKLTATEAKLHELTRDFTGDDVLSVMMAHEKSFVEGLRYSALLLLKRGDGVWCDRRDRLEYAIHRKLGRVNESDTIAMKVRQEEQTFFERLLRKKPVQYVEIELETIDPFGGDGSTRVYSQDFIDIVRKRSVTAMYHAVNEFTSKREESMSEIMQKINKSLDEMRRLSTNCGYRNKLGRIEDAVHKIS